MSFGMLAILALLVFCLMAVRLAAGQSYPLHDRRMDFAKPLIGG
jgi:hypothetical protein